MKIPYLIGGITSTILATVLFTCAAHGPMSDQGYLLQRTGQSISAYEGDEPKKALEYAESVVHAQKSAYEKNDHSLNREHVLKEFDSLESKIAEANEQIHESTSKVIYKPVLESIGEKIEEHSSYDSTLPFYIVGGIFASIVALIGYGCTFEDEWG
jgi:hypothetical protein